MPVYQTAIELVIAVERIVPRIPSHADLKRQLRRAAQSVPLNIAEGAGEFSAGDKARFYRMARRSATECAAIFDICKSIGVDEDVQESARALVGSIVRMLTCLVLHQGKRKGKGEGGGGGPGGG